MRRMVLLTATVSSVVSITVTMLVMAAISPTVVEAQVQRVLAQEFTLIGADGSTRATFIETPEGVVALGLLTEGQRRVALTARGDPPRAGLQVLAPDGTVRFSLGMAGQGPLSAGLGVFGFDGRVRATLTTDAGGDVGILRLYDREGRLRMHVDYDEAGAPFIELLDEDGAPAWRAPSIVGK